jgi:hypothetical protein
MEQRVFVDREEKEFLCTDNGIFDIDVATEKNDFPNKGEVTICEKWLKKNVEPRKKIKLNKSSYSYKHDVEEKAGKYVSNGAFIQACINLGYDVFPHCPNAYFNFRMKK